jgi:hypothetical protein
MSALQYIGTICHDSGLKKRGYRLGVCMSPERHRLKLKAMSVGFDKLLVKAKKVFERQTQCRS